MARTELTEKQLEFIEWLVTPKDERDPPFQREWCAATHTDQTTVYRWRHSNPLFIAAWNKRLEEEHLAPEKIGGMMDRLTKIAAHSSDRESVAAIKLYMEIVGKMAPKKLDIEAGPKVRDLSDGELALALAAAEEQKALTA